MKRDKVVSFKQLPSQLPTTGTAVWLLVLDRLHAPGWVWGVVITLLVLIWIIVIVMMIKKQQVELRELQ